MNKVIPTILSLNKHEFQERFEKLIKISKNIQIDFMDGKFVKNQSTLIADIPNLKKYNNEFEAHLMVENPQDYASQLKNLGFKKVIFHYESLKDYDKIKKLIARINEYGMQAFLAINPETNLSEIIKFVHIADGIMFLGVHPGEEKQEFIQETYNKIKELKEFNKKIIVQVDGGIDLHVAKALREIGVDIINTGSFVSNSRNPKQALLKLQKVFNQSIH